MEKRIVRLVALDDWECQNKIIYKWVEDVMDSLEKFGWSSGMVEKLEDVSLGKVGYILRDCAWPEVNKAWMREADERSKLGMVKNLMEGARRCVQMAREELRRIMAKLRGGTAELRVGLLKKLD